MRNWPAFGRWTGASYLRRLFLNGDEGLLDLYSAGRFSEDSGFAAVVDAVFRSGLIGGAGAGGWRVAYDGALAEFLVGGEAFAGWRRIVYP